VRLVQPRGLPAVQFIGELRSALLRLARFLVHLLEMLGSSPSSVRPPICAVALGRHGEADDLCQLLLQHRQLSHLASSATRLKSNFY
jgi:hypothetical protein